MSTPSLNVNLRRCTCIKNFKDAPCVGSCPSLPVLIPCPILRSVTFEVKLGECNCGHGMSGRHSSTCPGRTISVTGWVVGEELACSDVDDCELNGPNDFDHDGLRIIARDICRERWALVKALVLGKAFGHMPATMRVHVETFQQRDAVFAALADMARAEETVWQAQERACRTMEATFIPDHFMNEEPHSRPSASILERYVERLIEQVGAL